MHGTASFLRACLISIVVGVLCVDAVKSSVALRLSPTQIDRVREKKILFIIEMKSSS